MGFGFRPLGLTGSSAMNSAQENGVRCLPTHRRCHVTDAQRAPLLLRSTHGALRPTDARLPQPDAVRRFGGAGRHPRRGPRHGSPSSDRPAGPGIVGRVSHAPPTCRKASQASSRASCIGLATIVLPPTSGFSGPGQDAPDRPGCDFVLLRPPLIY